MKVLYIAPEHVTGGFNLFQKGHRKLGNDSRYVTFYRNEFGFQEDICLDLLGMPTAAWVKLLKKSALLGDQSPMLLDQVLPFRKSSGPMERLLFSVRDRLNAPIIEGAIKNHCLDDYDIYHFEQGADPYRDCRWIKRLADNGKGIVTFYHGTDVRNRGIFKAVHKVSQLNLTSEIDLLPKIPGMKYLYLPIDTEEITPAPRVADGRIRIAHAARNRHYKGSDEIERIVTRLAQKYPVDWVMIENLPHSEALNLKRQADIFVDQITDLGGWGYGASSVESLAMGLPTITRINSEVAAFLGDHPFISATPETLEAELIELIENENRRDSFGHAGRRWVIERHGLDSVMKALYGYYRDTGLI